VANGVGLVRKTGESLGKISEHVTSINGRIASIAQATGEQLTGVEEISTAVNQMDQATQQNAAMVEESTAVTHKMAEEVRELNALVAMFKTGAAMVAGEADRSIPAEDTKSSVPKPVVNTVPEAMVEAPRKTPMVSGNTALALDTDTDWEEF
jgi:methyl-accepting chemotaxis protein